MVHGRGTSGDSDSDITYFFHTALPWERLGRTISLASQGSCLQIAASPEPHAASLRFGRRQNTRHSGREGKKQSTAKVCLVYLGHTAGSLLVAKLQNSGLTQRAYKVKSTGLSEDTAEQLSYYSRKVAVGSQHHGRHAACSPRSMDHGRHAAQAWIVLVHRAPVTGMHHRLTSRWSGVCPPADRLSCGPQPHRAAGLRAPPPPPRAMVIFGLSCYMWVLNGPPHMVYG